MHKFHDIILAYLMGTTVQVRLPGKLWVNIKKKPEEGLLNFDHPEAEFRIKPTTANIRYKKILVRMFGEYKIINIHGEESLESMKEDKSFIRELSDWIEEEVEL